MQEAADPKKVVGPIQFLQRCDSKAEGAVVYDINVTGSSGVDGAELRRRRRRSSSAEDLKRLEKLREVREEALTVSTRSPRKPNSISTDTLSPRWHEIDDFRKEFFSHQAQAAPAKVVTPGDSPPREPRKLGQAQGRAEETPPAAPDGGASIPERVVLAAPAAPLRVAAPRGGAPGEKRKERKRRSSSINIPDRTDIDRAMGLARPSSLGSLAERQTDGSVEFIQPNSPRAEPLSPNGTPQSIEIEVASPLAAEGGARATFTAPKAPREPAAAADAAGEAEADEKQKCVIS